MSFWKIFPRILDQNLSGNPGHVFPDPKPYLLLKLLQTVDILPHKNNRSIWQLCVNERCIYYITKYDFFWHLFFSTYSSSSGSSTVVGSHSYWRCCCCCFVDISFRLGHCICYRFILFRYFAFMTQQKAQLYCHKLC